MPFFCYDPIQISIHSPARKSTSANMKYSAVVIAALAQLTLSSPLQKRQDIDFSAYKAVPTLADVAAPVGDPTPSPVTYDASAVATVAASAITTALSIGPVATNAAIKKRDACSSNAPGTGPSVTSPDDSASAFQSYSAFSAAATGAITPVGYQKVLTNGLGSAQDATYMTYTMMSAYDPTACAEFCQAHQGCNTFNICEFLATNLYLSHQHTDVHSLRARSQRQSWLRLR